jgi:triphosphoribosyl-dephospho-CoA synthase
MTIEQFRLSARASAPHLCNAALSVGEKIHRAVAATREAVGCNTNLGIVLLAAPAIKAFEIRAEAESLRQSLGRALLGMTRSDAEWTYRAIRLANPGGLGVAEQEDVREAPTIDLLAAMRLAEKRDRVARQYSNSFAEVFDSAIPSYDSKLTLWGSEEWAAVAVFVGLLARFPDTHIERKFGDRYTGWVAGRIAMVERHLSQCGSPQESLPMLRVVDAEFKSRGINPGTTADLTVACVLIARLMRHCGDRG